MPLSHIRSLELLEAMPDATIVVNHRGIVLFANDLFLQLVGFERHEVIDEDVTRFLQDKNIFDSCMTSLGTAGSCLDHETFFIHRSGELIHTVKSVRPLESGKEPFILASIRSLSAVDSRNRALEEEKHLSIHSIEKLSMIVKNQKRQLTSAKRQLEEVLAVIDEIIWYIDDNTLDVIHVNRAVESIFGVQCDDFISNPNLWKSMVYPEDHQKVDAFFSLSMEPGTSNTIDFRIRRQDGKIRWLHNRITHYPKLNMFIGVTHDITENKSTQELIEFLAYHDPLTKLPNRVFLAEKINDKIDRICSEHCAVAALFLDLDNFKYINDSKGHEVGDEVLVLISARIKSQLSVHCDLIRFGGDEFIILLTDLRQSSEAEECAGTVLECFSEPFNVNDEEFFLSASIGIATAPEHAQTSSDLIKHADTAMYAAKRSGKNQFRTYDATMEDDIKTFLRIEQWLKEGIKAGYFNVHYQPIVDAKTHHLIGFESLIRYEGPGEPLTGPDNFIPVAERTGDIIRLGATIIQNACRFARHLIELTGTCIPVSINLSARQFQDRQLLDMIKNAIYEAGIPPNALVLEVTESVIMRDIEHISYELDRLRETGIKIALDDFGTGYSSLAYLSKLPIDTIKIDQSFVRSLFHSQRNAHLVKAITTMAKALEINVTAEGVEEKRHADLLLDFGVKSLQGFLFSKALPHEQCLENIRRNSPVFTPVKHASDPSTPLPDSTIHIA